MLAVVKRGVRLRGSLTIHRVKILLRLIVEFLGFLLEFLESALRIAVDGVLGVLANVEPGFERLRSADETLLESL